MMLVRAGKSTPGRIRETATSSIIAAVVSLAVVSAGIGVAITSVRAVVGATPTCITVAAVYPIKVLSSAQILSFNPKDLGAQALNVKGWVVIRQPIPKPITSMHTMNPRLANVPDPSLGILVKHVCNTVKTEVNR
jgi:hypothetical protein